ncbi:hypothetical protein R1sor_021935 [Riccia sorocarpa]|uniref:Reverse transcriptase domain-containing protein n=1 Tax=Riccia sorocarpa TaxID=122646 RepID=A0ABD3GP90_9MARC
MGEWLKKPRHVGEPVRMGAPSSSGSWRDRVMLTPPNGQAITPNMARRIDLFNGRDAAVTLPNRLNVRNNVMFESSPRHDQEDRPRSQEDHRGENQTIAPAFAPPGNVREVQIPRSQSPEHVTARNAQFKHGTQSSPDRESQHYRVQDVEDSQGTTTPKAQGCSNLPSGTKTPTRVSPGGASWADKVDAEQKAQGEEEDINMSDLNSEKRGNQDYMEQRRWIREAKKEVTDAFSKIQELPEDPEREEVVIDHHFNTEEQLRIHAQKRRLEDCGVVFCTVDISHSRDTFTQWLYQEVENKTAVQVSHVKVLAPRHYLVILHSIEARDAVLAGGPCYMRQRIIYTTPWEPGFDTHRVLAKKMAVWFDLLNVDPMMEGMQEDGFKEVGGTSKNKTTEKEGLPEQSNMFEALGDEAAVDAAMKGDLWGRYPDDSSSELQKEPPQGVDTREWEEEQRQRLSEDSTDKGATVPDLNITPKEGRQSKAEKKKGKKARQREKRRKEGKGTKIMAIQELKTRERQVEFNLKTLMPGATVVVDYAANEAGGAALIVHESLQVTERGVNGARNGAWACIQIEGRQIYVASIYGPHNSEEKIKFFRWLKGLGDEKDWIWIGDWNMVLKQEDASGPSPLLKGSPLQAWNEVEIHWHLEDTYNIAMKKSGPRFTRQVTRGERLDQSRLDRAYINKSASWITEVLREAHDGTDALSDHNPVVVEVSIGSHRNARKKRKKEVYTKMDVDTLRHPERRRQIRDAWEEGWGMSTDPTIAWELVWGKAREQFKRFHKEDRERLSQLRVQQEALGELREKIQEGATDEEINTYRSLERSVHEAELLEASILRRRSRIRWTQAGDTNSKYFYSCFKAKQDQEKITFLENDHGHRIEDEDQVLGMVHGYYENLYSQTPEEQGARAERAEVLDLLDRGVTLEENNMLAEVPGGREILELVDALPKDKVPGEDGLTAEVLRESWEWTGDRCTLFIQEVWTHQNLPRNNKTAVVKLLPKSRECHLLKNWRSISLLSLSYKLIGRILANRLKRILPRLVDIDQTGFVEGRSIMDNVLSLKLCQDLTNVTGEPAVFCKLDFEKAFDRVKHSFLWDTLGKLSFSWKFIQLTQMLVSNGRAKVYINGRFTPTFSLQRGVRQGCLISPLLFAISTQPLMRLLRDNEQKGNLQGVSIPKGRPIMHKLFADDSGICIAATETNFLALKQIITRFEGVSGAKLNLGKSVILPMVLDRATPWLSNTGCRILSKKEEVRYLGCLVGDEVEDEALQKDLVERFSQKLHHWTNRFLSWPSKVTLARHILRALPVYQLLGLGLPEAGFKKLEVVCRTFIWGTAGDGRAKTTLISWQRTTTQKTNGGLGFRTFKDTASILKMKYVTRLLQGEQSEWSTMMRFLIHQEMKKRVKGKEYRWWSVEEGLLLLPTIPAPKGSVVRHFVKAWMKFREFLCFNESDWSLPGSITMSQLGALTRRYCTDYIMNEKVLIPLLRKLKCTSLMHLRDSSGQWLNIRSELGRKGFTLTTLQRSELDKFQRWLQKDNTDASTLQSSTSWNWKGDKKAWARWIRTSSFWSRLAGRAEIPENLSEKWRMGGDKFTWPTRWRMLWSNRASTRTKLWLWRTLKHGFFTGERAYKMGVDSGTCKRCNRTLETTEHLFWTCPKASEVWTKLRFRAEEVDAKFRIQTSVLATIDLAISNNKKCSALIHIVATTLQSIWRDRNSKIFNGKDTITPIEIVLHNARHEAEGTIKSGGPELT